MNPATAWNFAAGPARLPDAVLERARDGLFVRGADGASALERPFTGADFRATLSRARERLAQLLELPAGYRILFLAGGAMQQFALVPMNLLGGAQRAAYADSGYWAQRAIAEARRYCEVVAAPGFEGAAPLAAPPGGRWSSASSDRCASSTVSIWSSPTARTVPAAGGSPPPPPRTCGARSASTRPGGTN